MAATSIPFHQLDDLDAAISQSMVWARWIASVPWVLTPSERERHARWVAQLEAANSVIVQVMGGPIARGDVA